MDTPAPPSRTGLWLVLVLVLAFGVYSPSLFNGFTLGQQVEDPQEESPTGSRSTVSNMDLSPTRLVE